jgi:hypothetical protein
MRHRLIPTALAAGGSLAVIAGTAAGASPWTEVPSVNPSATVNFLNAVSARTATDAWAVGQFQAAGDDAGLQILAERWNGTQWQQVPTPNIVQEDERLLAASASGPNDAWAVGNENKISFASHDTLAAHWDGTAWTIVPTPAAASNGRTSTLNGVADFSPSDAWAVGEGSNARPLAEHWDGTAWSTGTLPTPVAPPGSTLASASLSSISAVSPTDIWAVGDVVGIRGVNTVTATLAMHYNGTAWSVVSTPAFSQPTTLNGVAAISASNAWAVGNTVKTDGTTNSAVIEHWNGTAWAVVSGASSLTALGSVSAASASDIWAIGVGLDTSGSLPVDVTRTLHWNGATWSVVPSPSGPHPGTSVSGVSALLSGQAWAVGTTGSTTTGSTTFIAHHTS